MNIQKVSAAETLPEHQEQGFILYHTRPGAQDVRIGIFANSIAMADYLDEHFQIGANYRVESVRSFK